MEKGLPFAPPERVGDLSAAVEAAQPFVILLVGKRSFINYPEMP